MRQKIKKDTNDEWTKTWYYNNKTDSGILSNDSAKRDITGLCAGRKFG